MSQQQYGGSLGGPIAARSHVLLRATRAAEARSVRAGHDRIRLNVAAINARLAAVGYPGAPIATGHLSEPVTARTISARSIIRSARATSSASATACTTSSSQNSRGAGGAERAQRLGRAGQHRSDDRCQQHGTLSPRTVNETRAQLAHGNLQRAAHRSDWPGRQHRRRGHFGTLSGSPTAAREHAVRDRRQPVAPGWRARAARGHRLPLQRRHITTRDRSAAAIRSRRWRISWRASTTTPASRRRSARPWWRRPIRTSASTRRTSGRSARA